jgi:hypothetical protein
MRRVVMLVALVWAGWGAAHVPLFPVGPGPHAVEAPAVSKAYYLRSETGVTQSFVVVPVARSIPLQLLVVDDELGQQLAHRVALDCGDGERELRAVDVAFFERFSGIAHRIRAVGAMGPTTATCTITVTQTAGPPGPYTLSIGDEERFSLRDIAGLLTLGQRLERWRSGE